MRKKIVAQRSLFDQAIDLLISIFKPEKKLIKMDAIIDANPDIITAVHADLTEWVMDYGCHGISAEQVVRSAILKQWKRYSYRELHERLNDGVSFRWFSRFYSDPIPHFSTLQKVIKSIKDETWSRINEILLRHARDKKLENGKSLRTDTTVVETNITYPVDARLLWDSIRVLTRIMERSRLLLPELNFAFAKRTRKAKKLCYRIIMAKGAKADQRRQRPYKDLIKLANEVYHMASRCLRGLSKHPALEVLPLYEELEHYLTMSAREHYRFINTIMSKLG